MIPLEKLPLLNACLNTATFVCLVTGFILIKKKNVLAHRISMSLAFLTAIAFLVSYLTYHFKLGVIHFQGAGIVRSIYLTILTTHTFLAASVLPLAITTFYRALKGDFVRHKKIARWTFPIWIYVSVTGVIIYLMLFKVPASF